MIKTLKHVTCKELELALNEPDVVTIDVVEGVLIDNIYFEHDDAFFIAAETYVNCWSSDYTVYYGDWIDIDKMWFKEFLEV